MRQLVVSMMLLVTPAAPLSAYFIDVPVEFREGNWDGDRGQGSCAWASSVMALRCVGQYELAEWYRETQGNGAYMGDLIRVAELCKLRFDYTEDGDRTFIEWALRNRLPVMIPYWTAHMVLLVGEMGDQMIILDNNQTGRYRLVPREEFYRRWRGEFSGFAMVFLYQPLPPWPRLEK